MIPSLVFYVTIVRASIYETHHIEQVLPEECIAGKLGWFGQPSVMWTNISNKCKTTTMLSSIEYKRNCFSNHRLAWICCKLLHTIQI